ncbi:MAG: VOC family protein [Actinomycetota bacterium]
MCWISTGGPDTAGLAAFYRSVFGWTANTDPDPGAGGYRNMTLDGELVAGVGFDNPLAPGWTMLVATSDIDQSCDRFAAAGGTVSLPPMPIGELATMSVVTDPAGAHLCFWEPRTFAGLERRGVPGSLHRCQLVTADPTRAIDFYADALGWTPNSLHDTVEGSPRWRVWFGVDQLAPVVDRAVAAGATLVERPDTTTALLLDPNGDELALARIT